MPGALHIQRELCKAPSLYIKGALQSPHGGFVKSLGALWGFAKVIHKGNFTKPMWRLHKVPLDFMDLMDDL